MKQTLVVMLKEPRPGRVKSRLGRDIGMTTAAWWFRHQTAALLRRVTDPRWQTLLAVSPDAEGLRSRIWPAGLHRIPQGTGSLGDRMARVLRHASPGPLCIIGADIPLITRAHIARSFALLGRNEVVLGPAPDGGYWLIGLRRNRPPPRGLFQGVRWSSEHALQDTLATLGDRRTAFADSLADVDTVHDLR
ncbi:TIGR04282 family arsenosugar biosynthesis glycosyltransferase [Roseobacter ponti]|uniref:Glycosyltransferase n=1 Tax=Roseobacter ponti TaxID=1891787 RepID=A0A858SZT7_9RHOB|nr:TIGR04282 family arsenosugar biosynthesis glycosyltransferase [Roseobacter ponti]QJF53011.1 glycosyltransferase [Roseobacter ponti]